MITATSKVLWQGLAVLDAEGRAVIWRGSDTPKLYRSEEQGLHARVDGCELVPVRLVVGALPGAVEHTRHVPSVDVPVQARAAAQNLERNVGALSMTSEDLVRVGTFSRPAPPATTEEPRRRQYQPKPCRTCKRSFLPTGPRSLDCDYCVTQR